MPAERTVSDQENVEFITIRDLILPERDGGYSKGRETRELILHTALRVLTEEGYRAMSMRRVAAECGIKFGNLTYYYRTREDLVRELLDAVITSYEQEFDALVLRPALSPEQRLERYCRLVLDDITSKKTTRFFPELWALSNYDPFVSERMHELYARARQPLFDVVADMRPDLSPEDQQTLTVFISFSMEGATIFAGYQKPFSDRMDRFKRLTVETFTAAVRSFRPG